MSSGRIQGRQTVAPGVTGS